MAPGNDLQVMTSNNYRPLAMMPSSSLLPLVSVPARSPIPERMVDRCSHQPLISELPYNNAAETQQFKKLAVWGTCPMMIYI